MPAPRSLFSAFGVELEYMIVDADRLGVQPVADRLLAEAGGGPVSDVDRGPISWSNELVAHVIELKTTGPVPALEGLEQLFSDNVREINRHLHHLGARLMPSAMHPWMEPARETRLWPLENHEVYGAFDRIFDCKGHGWSNLQSVHLNLPFADDAEFGRLHAAVRLVLPLLPALAASSPVMGGRVTGLLDNRLDVYRSNCKAIPSVTGRVIPEPVFSVADYHEQILGRMYADIAPHDPEKHLQHEWLNARGATARFDRNTIEIRLLDVQECPAADLAVCRAVVAVLRALVAEQWSGYAEQRSWAVAPLEQMLLEAIRTGEQAPVEDRAYLRLFGVGAPCTMGQLWQTVLARTMPTLEEDPALHGILRHGPLARRILAALPGQGPVTAEQLAPVYRRLCDCLAADLPFSAAGQPG